jgi:2-oxo-4-hydroxy-4-carboxy-5-ureidoimidazoline decarboxylase
MRIVEFNRLSDGDAATTLHAVCHSHKWVTRMLAGRPFTDVASMVQFAAGSWTGIDESDLLEAFSGHARIGDMDKLRDKYSRAHAEQGQVAQADESVLRALLDLNLDYEQRNGFIFIVCATGKSAGEMLAILRQRLPNDRAQELATAGAEQGKITAIRLRALLTDDNTV